MLITTLQLLLKRWIAESHTSSIQTDEGLLNRNIFLFILSMISEQFKIKFQWAQVVKLEPVHLAPTNYDDSQLRLGLFSRRKF